MEKTQDVDKELAHIKLHVERLERVQKAPSTKIALIGPQGAGKSLLTNALLNANVSPTGADGRACTSVIIRYAFAPGDKYHGEVKFLNSKQLSEMIEEHI